MMCAAPQTQFLALDESLPNRDELLDADLMKIRLSEILELEIDSCRIRRAKYQINHSLRVLYQIETETFVSIRIYVENPARIDYFVFPNDRKIQNLRLLNSPPKSFPGFWKTSKLAAYAPEKCVTVECLDTTQNVFAYAKIYQQDEFKTGEKVFRFLNEHSGKTLFPKVLGFDDLNKILMLKKVSGNCLANIDKSQNKQAFRMLGKAIGQLHETKTKVELTKFLRLSPDRIKKSLKTICFARPDCRTQAERLAEKLLKTYSFAAEQSVVLHGDVHPKNGILQDNNILTLIDLDQLSSGNPAAEIGSFLAGLYYREIIGLDSDKERQELAESFFRGYSETRELPNRESLNWHTAAALLTERAWRSISRIRVEGLKKFPEILAAGERVLRGGEK